MEGFIQGAIDFGKSIATKVYPVLDWVSQKISSFIDVSPENVHLILIGAGSMYIANILAGREMGIKFWAITGGLFFLFRYLGF